MAARTNCSERIKKMSKLCIYHSNCADGFTSAWVVRKALGVDTEFFPGVYQQEPPNVEGRDVILVDFSYKRDVLESIRDKAKSVLILDHHKSAQADLKDLPGVEMVFDMDRSGAGITWDYYFPNIKAPDLLYHIQDRDLWKFSLRKTREIQATVFSYPYEFNVWDYLMSADTGELAKDGEAIERKFFKDLRELLPLTTRRMVIGGYDVPVANLPYIYASDAGHILSKGEPFAATYYDKLDGRNFSLRSNDGSVDVSEIAKLYGGGGHHNAAGFMLSFEEASKFERQYV